MPGAIIAPFRCPHVGSALETGRRRRRRRSVGALECEHRRIRCETEEDAADRLVMRLPSLGLL